MNNKTMMMLKFIGVSIFFLSSMLFAGAKGSGQLTGCQFVGVDFYNYASKIFIKSGTSTKRSKLIGQRFEVRVKYRCTRNVTKVPLSMAGPRRNSFLMVVSKLKKGSHSIRVSKSNFKLVAGTYRFVFGSSRGRVGGMNGSVKMTSVATTCLTKKIVGIRYFGARAGTGYFKNCKLTKAVFRKHKRRPLKFVGQKIAVSMSVECSHKHHAGRKRHRHSSRSNRKVRLDFLVRAPKGVYFKKTIKIKPSSNSHFKVKTNLGIKAGLYFMRISKGAQSTLRIRAKVTEDAKCPRRIGRITNNFR